MDFISTDLLSLNQIAIKIVNLSKNNRKITFDGEIGAGKTTLIKSILNHLNVKDLVTSPTFSIVNEYSSVKFNSIYHIDFYRINKQDKNHY